MLSLGAASSSGMMPDWSTSLSHWQPFHAGRQVWVQTVCLFSNVDIDPLSVPTVPRMTFHCSGKPSWRGLVEVENRKKLTVMCVGGLAVE